MESGGDDGDFFDGISKFVSLVGTTDVVDFGLN